MARQRLCAEQWAALIEQWRAGGLSLPAFCERHGLRKGTMQNWVYKPALKLAVEEARRATQAPCETPAEVAEVAEPTPAFLPVKIPPVATEPESTRHAPIEVVLRKGRRIRVPRGFDPQTLRQVVAVLEG
jgi:hypothetical protein